MCVPENLFYLNPLALNKAAPLMALGPDLKCSVLSLQLGLETVVYTALYRAEWRLMYI